VPASLFLSARRARASDGASAPARHHQSGNDRNLGARALARLARTSLPLRMVCVGVAAGKACLCGHPLGGARIICQLGEGFCYRQQQVQRLIYSAHPSILNIKTSGHSPTGLAINFDAGEVRISFLEDERSRRGIEQK
jgi:hypothetical protein